jgi:RHS repeat-associated protein
MERTLSGTSITNAARGAARLLVALGFLVSIPAMAQWSALTPGLEASDIPGRPSLLALPGTGSNAVPAPSAPRVLVVGDESAEGLRFVNPDSGAALGFVALSARPIALAIDSAGTRAYVLTDEERLKVVDIAKRSLLASFRLNGSPRALVLREQAGQAVEVLVAQQGPDRVRGLNPANGSTVRSIELDHDPATLAWANGGARLLVGARGGRLYVLNAATLAVTASARIGDEIRHLSWWQAGGQAIVVHKRSDGISLVNIANGQVSAFVALDGDPERASLDASGERAYVVTRDDFSVNRVDLLRRALDGRYALTEKASDSIFDAASGKLILSQRGEGRLLRLDPEQASLVSVLELKRRLRDIAVNGATHDAVAVADKADELTRIRLSDLSTARVELPERARFVAVDTTLNLAVVGLKNRRLRFVDLSPADKPVLLAAQVALPDEPEALAVDSTRALAIALTDSKRRIHFVSTATRTLLSSLSLNEDAEALAVHSGRGRAYILTDRSRLLVVDLASRSIEQSIALQFRGNAIAVDEALDRAVITTDSGNKAHVLDLATHSLTQSHTLPRRPGAVAIQADSHVAVIASRESDQLSTLDLSSGVLSSGFLSLDKPFALAITSRYNKALVLSAEHDEVSFVQLPNPLPALDALAPASALAGSPAQVITLTGKHFIDSSRAYWNSTPLTTRWLGHTRLEAEVPASLLAAPGTAQVSVRTPAPAGGASNALAFSVGSAAPVLASIAPPSASADGQPKTLALGGQNFASGASVLFGATSLAATFNSSSSLSLTLPASLTQTPGTFTVSVVNPGGGASNGLPFTLTPALAIHSVTPAASAIGSVITLNGIGFDPVPAANSLLFRGAGGGTLAAAALSATPTQITVRVPPLAESGPIALSNARGSVQSPPFTVVRAQDFALVASPATVVVYQGASNSAQLQLSSTGTQPFSGLVSLSVQGLPSGASASFSPAATISAAHPVTLTIGASAPAVPGVYPITVRGEFTESGAILPRSAMLNLAVQASVGVTGVKGRFVTPEGVGVAGVIVRADFGPAPQPQTTTDAAGNFQLAGLPATPITFRFDATPANPLYPIWPYTATLAANQITVIPDWTINPPPPAERFSPIAPSAPQEQVITDERFPGLEIRIPAGAEIVGWDGVRKDRIAVEKVELTKLPVTPPPTPTGAAYQFYFGSAMGGIPSAPIPVTLPNDVGAEPGEGVNVYFFDGSPMGGSGEWKIAGQGIVSADGKTVRMPPGTGIPRFCGVCGLTCLGKQPPAPDIAPDQRRCGGNPVDLFNGQEMPTSGGLSCGGLTPISTGMTYNPVDAYDNIGGISASLGFGWVLDYDIGFLPFVGPQKRLVMPGNNRVNFTDDGTGVYRPFDDPRFDGAEFHATNPAANEWELRFRDRRVWRFKPFTAGIFQRGAPSTFVTEMVDPQGNVLAIERRPDGRITSVGSGERGVSMSYGANGFVSEIADTAGRTMRYTYTPSNRLSTVADADGRITSYTYVGDSEFPVPAVCGPLPSTGERLKTITYPGRPNPTENFYGAGRRVLRQTGYDGREFRFAYKVTGACVTHTSSPNTRCTGTSCPDVDSWDNFQAGWRFYGGTVVATTMTHPNGQTTSAEFNARGVATADTDAQGQKRVSKVDAANRITERTDPLGRTQKFQYDGKGNVTQMTDALGRITNITYHPVWNTPTSITRFDSANQPQTWTFTYDAAKGTLLTSTNPLNQATTLSYTSRGQLEMVTDALNHATRYEYNTSGDLTKITDALLNETRFGVDGAGRMISMVDALNHTTRNAYNGIDRVTRVTDARSQQTNFAYDAAGRLDSITGPRGFVVESYGYDAGDRMTSRRDAKSRQTLYDYDTSGRLERTTTRRGAVMTYAYDGNDRIVSATRPEGVTRFSYDVVGRITEVADPSGTITYAYDAVDRLVRETQAIGGVTHVVEYGYDALDRRTSRTLVGVADEVTNYGYDAANRLTSITYRGQSTTLEYDAAGRLVSKVLPNGIRQRFTYDDANRLLSIEYRNPDDSLIDAISYGYDAAGRRVTETRGTAALADSAFTATYDEADRMSSVTLMPSGETFLLSYDDNGNLASKLATGNPAIQTFYTWDSRNRLTGIAGPGISASFEYDPLSRRAARTVNGTTTRYVYDGAQAFGEVTNGAQVGQLTGLGLDEAIARHASQGARIFLTDALNSVFAQTREDRSLQNYYSYSPYGEVSALGPDEGNSIQYTARENDLTGLYYYRARYYDPVLKRFISEDPLGVAGGDLNLAAYVRGNPISLTDPTGEVAPIFLIGLGAAYGFYKAMDWWATLDAAARARAQAQQAQEALNAQLAACLSFPQGGACQTLPQAREYWLRCVARTAGAGAQMPGTIGNPEFPELRGKVPELPASKVPSGNNPRHPIFPSDSGERFYDPGYNRR